MKTKKQTYNGLLILTFALTMIPIYLALFGVIGWGWAGLIGLPSSFAFGGVLIAQE